VAERRQSSATRRSVHVPDFIQNLHSVAKLSNAITMIEKRVLHMQNVYSLFFIVIDDLGNYKGWLKFILE